MTAPLCCLYQLALFHSQCKEGWQPVSCWCLLLVMQAPGRSCALLRFCMRADHTRKLTGLPDWEHVEVCSTWDVTTHTQPTGACKVDWHAEPHGLLRSCKSN